MESPHQQYTVTHTDRHTHTHQLIYQTLMFTLVKHLYMSWPKRANSLTFWNKKPISVLAESYQTNG